MEYRRCRRTSRQAAAVRGIAHCRAERSLKAYDKVRPSVDEQPPRRPLRQHPESVFSSLRQARNTDDDGEPSAVAFEAAPLQAGKFGVVTSAQSAHFRCPQSVSPSACCRRRSDVWRPEDLPRDRSTLSLETGSFTMASSAVEVPVQLAKQIKYLATGSFASWRSSCLAEVSAAIVLSESPFSVSTSARAWCLITRRHIADVMS